MTENKCPDINCICKEHKKCFRPVRYRECPKYRAGKNNADKLQKLSA